MTRPPLPAAFVARVLDDLGEGEGAALCAALEAPSDRGLRVHPRHGSPEALLQRLGYAHEALPWCREGVALAGVAGRHPASRHPWHEGGAYYLQDPAAMGVVPLLDPQPGEWILDLAAAPGGKATHAEARLGGRGLLWAHERDPVRAGALGGNLERWGATQAVVSQGDPAALRAFAGRFDRVLLDAPCSGEGMFRKSDAARSQWSPSLVARCAALQGGLLDLAAELLKPGGVLVYATCTFAGSENEGAVAALLARHPELALDEGPPPGFPTGVGGIGARWWPHRGRGDGHFAARLRKVDATRGTVAGGAAGRVAAGRVAAGRVAAGRGGAGRGGADRGGAAGRGGAGRAGAGGGGADRGGAGRGTPKRSGLRLAEPRERGAYEAFVAERFGGDPLPGHELHAQGEALVALPAGAPTWAWRRAGVAVGSVARDRSGLRFTPHHALSRVLATSTQGAIVDLPADDPQVGAFLRGEALALSGDGWSVLRADGVALGWVKAQRGVANNHFPRGLRRGGGGERVETSGDS